MDYAKSRNTFDPVQAYGKNPLIFTLRINHGRWFTLSLGRRYLDGEVRFIDWVDEDKFSVLELNDMMVKIGYPLDQEIYYHFMIPDQNLDYGLRVVGNDSDVLYILLVRLLLFRNLMMKQGPTNLVRRTLAFKWHKNEFDNSGQDFVNTGNEGSVGSEGGDGVEDSDGFLVDKDNAIDHYEVDMQHFRAAVDMDFDEEAVENQSEDVEHIDDFDLDNFDSLSDEENDTTFKKKLREL